VIIICDNYKYETDEIVLNKADTRLNFNHTFHIRVGSFDQAFKLLLRDQKQYSENEDYKEWVCNGTLSKFQDSKTHELWFDLLDSNGKNTGARIHLKLSFAFSRTSFFEEAIKKLMRIENKLIENRNNIEFSLKQLVYPFAHPNAGNF
jgi:hypothetical protein